MALEKIKGKLKNYATIDDSGLVPNDGNVAETSLPENEFKRPQPYEQKHKASIPRGSEKSVLPSGEERDTNLGGLPHSQFSDYHLFRLKSVGGENYPMTNKESAKFKDTLYREMTPQYLIDNPMGASIYKPADFIYLERLNKLPLNRMITLRRFAHPIVDDIFSITPEHDEPDISRMITYTDQETNKLSEIMGFSMGMRWKELNSTMEEMNMHGVRAGVSGYMRNVLKFVDPTFGQDRLRGDTALSFDPIHDSNKVYGMVDSISSSHIRDIGLNFDQEFKLVFKYKMRSFNGVNGKAAFLDMLSNVLLCCTNDAKFWGGSRYWKGRRPSQYMKHLKFLSPTSFNDFLNKSHVSFKGFLGEGSGDTKKDAVNLLKNVAKNVFNMGFGKLLDKIGRPSIPYTNSLLTNNPVGNWHITIGNPHNPSMTVGNLLLTNTTITFGEILGYDDFPEDITVECNLKHAMPRGRAEIEQMFLGGRGRMYWKPEDVFGSLKGKKPQISSNNPYNKPATPSFGGSPQTPSFGGSNSNGFGGTSSFSKSSITPKPLSELMENKNMKFGKFDKASVLRNAQKVWSFDKVKSGKGGGNSNSSKK